MKREEFCCVIGYQGGEALVDRSALREVKNRSVKELTERGLYRAAMAAALYDKDTEAQDYVVTQYRERCSTPVENREQLERMLGIFRAFDETIGVKLV